VPVTGGEAIVLRELRTAGGDFEIGECGVYYVDYAHRLTGSAS